MAKKAKKSVMQEYLQVWWIRIIVGLLFIAVAYGFGSWAIDSGNLLHYMLALAFLYFGIAHFALGIRRIFTR